MDLCTSRVYTMDISGLSRLRNCRGALLLFDDMCRAGVTVDMISCNAAISACKKGGQWQQALSLLDDMHKASVIIHVISFNATISACKKECG